MWISGGPVCLVMGGELAADDPRVAVILVQQGQGLGPLAMCHGGSITGSDRGVVPFPAKGPAEYECLQKDRNLWG